MLIPDVTSKKYVVGVPIIKYLQSKMEETKVESKVDESKTNFDVIYDGIKGMIANKTFSSATFMLLIPRCMELAESLPKLTGLEKKALVIEVLGKLIDELPMQDDDKKLLRMLILTVIPSTIDLIVSSSLGQFAINLYEEAEQEVTSCFARCSKKDTVPRQRQVKRVLKK